MLFREETRQHCPARLARPPAVPPAWRQPGQEGAVPPPLRPRSPGLTYAPSLHLSRPPGGSLPPRLSPPQWESPVEDKHRRAREATVQACWCRHAPALRCPRRCPRSAFPAAPALRDREVTRVAPARPPSPPSRGPAPRRPQQGGACPAPRGGGVCPARRRSPGLLSPAPQSGLSFPFQADGQGRGRAAAHPGDLLGLRHAGRQQAGGDLPVRVRPAQLPAGGRTRAPQVGVGGAGGLPLSVPCTHL